jgi:hypothetical protein
VEAIQTLSAIFAVLSDDDRESCLAALRNLLTSGLQPCPLRVIAGVDGIIHKKPKITEKNRLPTTPSRTPSQL